MSEFNIWLETEEVNEHGDQICEVDHLCEKLAHVDTEEEAEDFFREISNCHIAYGRLKQFCQLAAQAHKMVNPVLELQKLAQDTRQALNMVGLLHKVK